MGRTIDFPGSSRAAFRPGGGAAESASSKSDMARIGRGNLTTSPWSSFNAGSGSAGWPQG